MTSDYTTPAIAVHNTDGNIVEADNIDVEDETVVDVEHRTIDDCIDLDSINIADKLRTSSTSKRSHCRI